MGRFSVACEVRNIPEFNENSGTMLTGGLKETLRWRGFVRPVRTTAVFGVGLAVVICGADPFKKMVNSMGLRGYEKQTKQRGQTERRTALQLQANFRRAHLSCSPDF